MLRALFDGRSMRQTRSDINTLSIHKVYSHLCCLTPPLLSLPLLAFVSLPPISRPLQVTFQSPAKVDSGDS